MTAVPSDYNGAANPYDLVTVQHDAFHMRVHACACACKCSDVDANAPATLQLHKSAARTIAVGGRAI